MPTSPNGICGNTFLYVWLWEIQKLYRAQSSTNIILSENRFFLIAIGHGCLTDYEFVDIMYELRVRKIYSGAKFILK